ncbi:hypothetical protein [Bacillus sp. FJAT-27251]|uniref:hypothetical protein n=1 Tax=Bacillus sp. FJAT-27251 TaxID=1684142 RepID=UPI0018D0F406|nr:hypothetical protein [Bacillus sp. FJAT-27251]
MATSTIFDPYTLTESDVQKLLKTPRTKIPETNLFNDIKLSNKDRIRHAESILKSRKCK